MLKHIYVKVFHYSTYLSAMYIMYLAQVFWFAKAWRLLGGIRLPFFRKLLRSLLLPAALVLLATGIDPLRMSMFPHQGPVYWVLTAARTWLFASSLGLIAIAAVRAAGWIMIKAAPGGKTSRPNAESRRDFLRYLAFAAGSVPFIALAYGYASRLNYRVRRVDIPVSSLPERLDGLKIVQLSDIHCGDFLPPGEVRRAVEKANALNADLAVVTGDFISWKGDPLEDCIRELGRLRAPLGVWGCNGNHEGYARVERKAQELFHRYGMRLLRRQRAVVEHCGEKINLIGVDYQMHGGSSNWKTQMLHGVEPLVRRDMPNILLSHNPNTFYRAAGLGIELSLAGHTHGGQIRLDIDGKDLSPAFFYTEFVAGTYRLPFAGAGPGSATLYVNRGLGTIWIPARIEVPPEITLITLRRAV